MAVKKTKVLKNLTALSETSPALCAPSQAVLTPDAVESKFHKALENMVGGSSARDACKKARLPQRSFYRLIGGDEDKRGQYARAREACADAQFDELDELAGLIRDGEIKPDVGRVIADIMKFKLAHMRPEAYGKKQSIDLNAKLDIERLQEAVKRAGQTT